MAEINLDSDNPFTYTLFDADGNPVTGATVTVTVRTGKAKTSAEVDGPTWPLTMTDPDDDGTYEVNLPDTLDVVEGQTVYAHVSADGPGSDDDLYSRIRLNVVVDDGSGS